MLPKLYFLISICMEYLFLSPHLLSVCIFKSEVGLLWQHIYGPCFFYPFSHICLLMGTFNPFTAKVIIYRYILIAIVLKVLGLFCRSFLFFFFCALPFDLKTVFSVKFEFPSLFFSVYLLNVFGFWLPWSLYTIIFFKSMIS